MKTIYKYTICSAEYGDSINQIKIPKNSTLLKVARQYDNICVWMLVDDEETEMDTYTWYQIGTGHPLPKKFKDEYCIWEDMYIDTIVCDDLGYVWNIFCNIYEANV